jgi:hypothetical protein
MFVEFHTCVILLPRPETCFSIFLFYLEDGKFIFITIDTQKIVPFRCARDAVQTGMTKWCDGAIGMTFLLHRYRLD